MNTNKKLHITHGLIIIGIVLAGFSMFTNESIQYYILGIGTVTSIIGILYGIIMVRCPFCHHALPLIGTGEHCCPNCGEILE